MTGNEEAIKRAAVDLYTKMAPVTKTKGERERMDSPQTREGRLEQTKKEIAGR